MTLRKLIEMVDDAVYKQFRETGQVLWAWHMIDRKGSLFIKHASCEEKDAEVVTTKAFMIIADIVAVVLVSEAWTLRTPTVLKTQEELAVLKKKLDREGISQHPDRLDIIMFNAEDENGAMLAWREIIRPAKGKAQLGPLEFKPDGGVGEGRLIGMLPQRGTRQ